MRTTTNAKTRAFWIGGTTVVILLLSLYLLAEYLSTSSYIVPSFGEIFSSFRETWVFAHVGSDVLPSLYRMFSGLFLAIFIGVVLGFLVGTFRILDNLTEPTINFLRAIPAAALLPPAMVLFGVGDFTKISIIAFVCIWPILLNTRDGVQSLDETMLNSANVYGVTGLDRFVFIILPAVTPRIFAGVRVSLSIAILLLVTSEMVASTNGIGYFVFLAQQQFAVADMWAGVILLSLLGFTFNFALQKLERRTLRWHLAS